MKDSFQQITQRKMTDKLDDRGLADGQKPASPILTKLAGKLRAAAHGAAVHALITSSAPDHDRAAVRAGWRILLIKTRNPADASHGRSAPQGLCRNRNDFFTAAILVVSFLRFLPDDADLLLRITIEELNRQPTENVVHN